MPERLAVGAAQRHTDGSCAHGERHQIGVLGEELLHAVLVETELAAITFSHGVPESRYSAFARQSSPLQNAIVRTRSSAPANSATNACATPSDWARFFTR
jgi:hypothetical protein